MTKSMEGKESFDNLEREKKKKLSKLKGTATKFVSLFISLIKKERFGNKGTVETRRRNTTLKPRPRGKDLEFSEAI